MVILGVSAILGAAVVVPRIAGATPYTILTGSMQPSYPPGTLVVVRPSDHISTGSVITYQLESGKPAVVTHRVMTLGFTATGERRYVTKGDANDTPDAKAVRDVQIKGEVWYSIPYLGYLNNWLTGKERQMMIYIVAALLLGYAALMLVGAAREWLSKRGGDRVEQARR
nr:signal peptidase I [Nocardioides daedukensis]